MTPAPAVHADLMLTTARPERIAVGLQPGAQAALEVGGELPFGDRSITSLALGDAVTALATRDQLQLLLECRRVLVPGAMLHLVEEERAGTFAAVARWAELIGLVALPTASTDLGWAKRNGATPSAAPLVTIAIPSSNPRYFLECLDSAITQTYANLEILVSDDSEGDLIAAMIAARGNAREIRLVRNPQRLRTRRNFEQCLVLARGEFVKFLNDDDVLEPDCVATLVDAFLRIPDLTLATSHRLRIGADSQPLGDMPATRPVVDRDVVVNGTSLANAAIMHGLNFIGEPSTALFRKRDFDRRIHVDGERPFHFNGEEVRGAIDFAMWSRLLVQGNAAFFCRRLSRFRIHGEQAQARPEVMQRSIEGIRGLQRQWIELGLFRRWAPQLLAVQDFPGAVDATGEWRPVPVGSQPAAAMAPADALRAWRAIRRHAFETPVQGG